MTDICHGLWPVALPFRHERPLVADSVGKSVFVAAGVILTQLILTDLYAASENRPHSHRLPSFRVDK